jgi:hypothetical protein
MDRDILLLQATTSFDAFLRQPGHAGKIRHVVVARDDRIVGVLRVNTGIRHGLESAYTGVTLGDVASRDFTTAHEEDIMFGVIGRIWQRGAMMAVVVRGNGASPGERRARRDHQGTCRRLGCAQCAGPTPQSMANRKFQKLRYTKNRINRMTKRRYVIAQLALIGLSSASCLSGCATLPRRAVRSSSDRAFIDYWPPENNNRLSLAVKDNIDMKGVVTTAGSKYIADTSPPAPRDAKCMAISRERNVQIVGKTNLSEFAVAPSGLNEYFGTPRNPFSKLPKRIIPGGSSSGSAVAVATGEARLPLGPIRRDRSAYPQLVAALWV